MQADRLLDRFPPSSKLGLTLAEERAHEALQRLYQARVRNVALELLELARCKKATRGDEPPVQFIHQGRFANARISGNEHQPRRAAGHESLEGGKEGRDVAFPAVQPLRDEKPVRHILRCEGERIDMPG